MTKRQPFAHELGARLSSLPRAACATRPSVHEISFELTKEISVRKGETCCSPPRRWQGAIAGGSLCLPPCPLRLPLLFPKSSSILFGSPKYSGSATVSPLCASSRQGAMAGGALRLPPCPLRLPLLFPKNLAALRFSGALFIFRAHLYQNRAAFTSIRMLIRETKQNAILPRFEYYLE